MIKKYIYQFKQKTLKKLIVSSDNDRNYLMNSQGHYKLNINA
jgi:hypothetical protein